MRDLRAFFSNIRLRNKFRLVQIAALLVVLAVCAVMLRAVRISLRDKEEALEGMMLTSTEQYVGSFIEGSVAIAKSIYINQSMYEFLDGNYRSSEAYFDAFHRIQESSPLLLADNNESIAGCTIYTDNPTVMNGSRIRMLGEAGGEDWYKTFVRLGKPLILYLDPETGTLSLLRALDYYPSNYKGLLKLDLSTEPLDRYCRSLGFEGRMCVICGGTELYSSGQDIAVDTNFAAVSRNYYTVDIEYYADASHQRPWQLILQTWWMLLIILAAGGLLMYLASGLAKNVLHRTERALSVSLSEEADLSALRSLDHGKDEIGDIIRTGIALSDRYALLRDRYDRAKEKLRLSREERQALTDEVLRLRALEALRSRHPGLALPAPDTKVHPLAQELSLVCEIAGLPMPEDVPETEIPVCVLADLADTLLTMPGELSVEQQGNALHLHYQSQEPPPQSWALYINAVFEDDFYAEALRPYIRLRSLPACRVRAEETGEMLLEVRSKR